MEFTMIQDVRCSADLLDTPDKAVITITEKDAARILEAHDIVVNKDYSSIKFSSASVEYKKVDYDSEDEALIDWDVRTDCDQVFISKGWFMHTALVGNTDAELSVEGMSIQGLKEVLEIGRATPEQLLKWINREWDSEDVKEFFNAQFAERKMSTKGAAA